MLGRVRVSPTRLFQATYDDRFKRCLRVHHHVGLEYLGLE